MGDEGVADVEFGDGQDFGDGGDVVDVEAVAGVDGEAAFGGEVCGLFYFGQLAGAFVCGGVGVCAGVQFDGGRTGVEGGLDLGFVGVDEEGDADAGSSELVCVVGNFLLQGDDVEAAFGGDFLPFFGDDAHVLRAHAQGVFEHFFGECHFEVDVGAHGAGDGGDVVVADVAAVFAQVEGNVVGTVGFGGEGGFEGAGVGGAACVAQGGDVVDVDAEEHGVSFRWLGCLRGGSRVYRRTTRSAMWLAVLTSLKL